MTRYLRSLLLALTAAAAAPAWAQNNNGQLDALEELATKYTRYITLPDGTRLATDIFLPITSDSLVVTFNLLGQNVDLEIIPKGTQIVVYPTIIDPLGNPAPNPNPYRLPFLVTRTPYDRQGIGAAGGALTLFGYAYASEDTRGRFGSEGIYLPLYSDSWAKSPYQSFQHALDTAAANAPYASPNHEDGIHSIDYYLQGFTRDFDLDGDGQVDVTAPACNGTIGLAGASAFAMPHLQAAATRPINPNQAGIKGMLTAIATGEHFKCTGYHNGVLRQSLMYNFLDGQWDALEEDSTSVDNTIFNDLHTPADYGMLTRQTVQETSIDHFTTIPYGTGSTGAYPNSEGRVQMDISAAPVNAAGQGDPNGTVSRYAGMQTPNYHLTGWYDVFITGQIETFNHTRTHLTGAMRRRQKLVIGPWTHLALTARTVGDVTYPENVADVVGITADGFDPNNLPAANFSSLLQLEPISFMRYALNANGHVKLGEPVIRIPESRRWQQPTAGFTVRVPSENYDVPLTDFINFIGGQGSLPPLRAQVDFGLGASNINLPIPSIGNLLPVPLPSAINPPRPVDFDTIPAVRMYVMGATDTAGNSLGAGNYWFASDHFPLYPSQVNWQNLYLHQSGTLDANAPTTDEGVRTYAHDPNNPVITHGGNNMFVETPDGSRRSEGQMDYSDPAIVSLTLPSASVVQFASAPLPDTLCIIGYPKATIFAASQPRGAGNGETDTDFFVRILDACPDGRELLVVEGAVNARAREYARSLYNEAENNNAPYSNIQNGQFYGYQFELLPIAYTFGAGHQIKVVISSSNYPKYQANANVPIEAGEFFRRLPNDGRSYTYQGQTYAPRIADNSVAFSPTRPSRIELPVFNGTLVAVAPATAEPVAPSFELMPNPAGDWLRVQFDAPTQANSSVFVYNALGQIVLQQPLAVQSTQAELSLRHLPAGVYTLHAQGESRAFVKK